MSTGLASEQRSRTFTWEDPVAAAAEGLRLSGLDYIRGIAAGGISAPPIARLLDFTIVEAEPGRAVFAVEPAEWMFKHHGRSTGALHPGDGCHDRPGAGGGTGDPCRQAHGNSRGTPIRGVR